MSVFGDYSQYYDLLYKDKDYQSETNFIDKLIKKHNPGASSILNLGCGTGKHDFLLAQNGYTIHGVDISEEMLSQANHALDSFESKNIPSFHKGDIRSVRLEQKFDVVTSLFHVVSYLTNNQDHEQFFETAKTHLKPNGLLLFDFWYGPAVLTIKPEVKVKRLHNKTIEVTRVAEPKLLENQNVVEVNYDIFIQDKKTKDIKEIKETHLMRYLFLPEVEQLVQKWGFKLIEQKEWLSGQFPSTSSWGVYCIAKLK